MAYKIKSRIWIEVDGNILLGEGRIRLLKAIQDLGSLSKAARSLDMSYKKAWNLIDSINKNAKKPVVTKTIGGKGGGGATLTPHGEELVSIFRKINNNCWKFLDSELETLNVNK